MRKEVMDQGVFGFAKKRRKPGPKRSKDSGIPHRSRPELKKSNVAHVTIKLIRGLPSLRRGEALEVVRAAIERVNDAGVIRIVEFSIQSNHVHLLIEAKNSADLSRGMASLNTGLGMRLNRLWNRVGKGSVFVDRFHMVVIDTPSQMRHALAYVLRNDSRHGLELDRLDPCSSAPFFTGWVQPQGHPPRRVPAKGRVNARPKTWLLRQGWQRVGGGKSRLLSWREGPAKTGPPAIRIEPLDA